MKLPVEKVNQLLIDAHNSISLSQPVYNGERNEEGSDLENFVLNPDSEDGHDYTVQKKLEKETKRVLATLSPREEKILRMRCGISEKRDWTLEEIGQYFTLSRERVRQIEAKALRKLRCPSRAGLLRSFVE